jgi:hypothetical protein
MAGLWEKQLQKLNSEVAKSKESWEQFNRSRGSGPGAAASEPSSPMKEGSAGPVGPKLHHTVSITEVPDEQELGK